MSDMEANIAETIDEGVENGRLSAILKPDWEALRDTGKTLISLSGATLVFTITFSQSVIRPDTPIYWRYAVVACWLSFILCLVSCLGSLWFSMTPAKRVLEESTRTGGNMQFIRISIEALRRILVREKLALWLLRLGIIFCGLALSGFTAIGLRQLLQ